ncbi:hypothetical protein [Mesorhizobium sp. CCNWLY176]
MALLLSLGLLAPLAGCVTEDVYGPGYAAYAPLGYYDGYDGFAFDGGVRCGWRCHHMPPPPHHHGPGFPGHAFPAVSTGGFQGMHVGGRMPIMLEARR